MRKIQPTLQSQGYNTFDDLLSKSIPKPSNIITVGPSSCDYTSPFDAAAAANSGDLIVVYPGTYDVGNNSILLKDGVNWQFMPGVTITSSSANGTFYDNNVAVNVKFEGEPIIDNTSTGQLIEAGFGSIVSNFSVFIDGAIALEPNVMYFQVINSNIPKRLFDNATVTNPAAGRFVIDFGKKLFDVSPEPYSFFLTIGTTLYEIKFFSVNGLSQLKIDFINTETDLYETSAAMVGYQRFHIKHRIGTLTNNVLYE